jgi:hypothetical protein
MKSSHVRYGVALANSIPFSLSVPVASFPWVWPVRRTYFGALGAKTVPYCDRLVRLCAITMVLFHLGYVTVFFGFGCGSGISYPKGLACTYCKGPSVDHYWSDRTVHPLHLALAIPSQHVGRACSSHQFCRGFGQRGHRDRWHLLRGHEELSVPCHICAVSPARTHPIQPYFDQTSPRTEEGGSLCAIRSRRINASQPSRAIIVVRRAEAEASLRSLRSGGNEVSQSLLPPSELHPTSTLSEMVHDGGSRASLGLDPTR